MKLLIWERWEAEQEGRLSVACVTCQALRSKVIRLLMAPEDAIGVPTHPGLNML